MIIGLNQIGSNFASSRGIVMGVHGFSGPIQMSNNTVLQNMVYAPSALFTNYQKFNKNAQELYLSNFELSFRGTTQLEFRIFSEILKHDINLFNYYDPMLFDQELETNYQSYSPIFIKDARSSYVLFENNTFDSNIGLHGGAVNIQFTQTNASEQASTILFKNNTFQKNMAYFKGNAINIRGFSNGTGLPIDVQIEDCLFIRNQGINIADGAAVNINGGQNHTYKYDV